MNEQLDRALEMALYSMPAPDFKARLWAELERTIAMTPAASVGLRNLTPYLHVPDLDKMLAFYTAAFGAEEQYRNTGPRGFHAQFKIGDSELMMGGPLEAGGPSLHLYVDDLEGTVQRSLDGGGELIYPITQAHYGERFAGVKDPGGNNWIVAERATSTLRHESMGTVTAYLNPIGAAKEIAFLEAAFGAEVLQRFDDEPRGVVHSKVRIGNSVLELGDPEDGKTAVNGMFYLYANDVDAVYQSALAAGAASIHAPAMQHYGHYVGAFTDPTGSRWYIASEKAPAEQG